MEESSLYLSFWHEMLYFCYGSFTSYDFLILWIFKLLVIASKVKFIQPTNINDSLSYLFFFHFYTAFFLLSSFHLVLISDFHMKCFLHLSSGLWISIPIDNSLWMKERPNWWASLQGGQNSEMSKKIYIDYFYWASQVLQKEICQYSACWI